MQYIPPLKKYFDEVLIGTKKGSDLYILLNQEIVDENPKSLFELIKMKLWLHESSNIDMWKNPDLWSGKATMLLTAETKKLVSSEFVIPVLNIKVTTGTQEDIDGKPGVRIVWEKQKN